MIISTRSQKEDFLGMWCSLLLVAQVNRSTSLPGLLRCLRIIQTLGQLGDAWGKKKMKLQIKIEENKCQKNGIIVYKW